MMNVCSIYGLLSYCKTAIFKRTITRSCQNFIKPIVRVQSNRILKKIPENPVRIDHETVNLLERLSLVDCANERSLKLIEDAVNFANAIHSVDTEGVEPLVTVLEDRPLQLREDVIEENNSREEITRNAAIIEEDYFVVPPGNVPLESEDLFEKDIIKINE